MNHYPQPDDKTILIHDIHESLSNGQRRQMVEQINEYGTNDFFTDYRELLTVINIGIDAQYMYFQDATISFFRITNQ